MSTSVADQIPLAYRVADAAQVLGCSRSTIYELLTARKLSARKLGGITLIPRSELERYLNELPPFEGAGDEPVTR